MWLMIAFAFVISYPLIMAISYVMWTVIFSPSNELTAAQKREREILMKKAKRPRKIVYSIRPEQVSMMRNSFIILFSCIVNISLAQQGRHELPIDTIPIGGEEQRVKMTRMRTSEELENDLISLRDSIASFTDRVTDVSGKRRSNESASNNHRVRLNAMQKKLNTYIKQLKASDKTDAIEQNVYDGLHEVRKEFKEISKRISTAG